MPGEGPSTVEGAPLGERPRDDDLALDVVEARIATKLFGVERQVTVGRYRLLEEVGRGGMGVVWGAWDPELERKVAVKLVDPLREAARDRIVEEARALAKLSHPNVVPIYDVGVVDDRVYLVMEWVAGENLRAYLGRPRSVREIVELYRQAACGLAAVHAAGLVHRDFKPENAMVGHDDRVRVLDFGVARGDAVTDEVAGTPRYMAPEQRAGTASPAVDQYALCVALREALEDRGEVPRWLARIVARGTAARAEDRFGSLEAVIRALGRDPARVWGRRIAVGAGLVAIAGAFAVGRTQPHDACTGDDDAGAWTETLRSALVAHVDTLGEFAAAERPALVTLLDDRQRGWADARRAACVAHESGGLTTAMYERRLTCLARVRASLSTTAEILVHSTADSFPDARIAADAILDPAHCDRVDQSLVPLPAPYTIPLVRAAESAIERARMLATAERSDAVKEAEAARAVAQQVGYAPLIARALLVEGRAQMVLDDQRAAATLEQAMRSGFAARDDATAVEAFARMAFVTAMKDSAVSDGSTLIQAVAGSLDRTSFPRLLLLNNLAAVRIAMHPDQAGAQPLLEEALRDWRPGTADDDYELVSIPENLALAIDDPKRSSALLAQARAEAARRLGEGHPRALDLQRAQAVFLDLEHARPVIDAVCARIGRLFPHLAGARANCELDAGWLADEANDRAAAAAHFRSAPLPARSATRVRIAATMAALDSGAPPAPLASEIERAADAERATNTTPWGRSVAGDAYIAAARAWSEAGDAAAALRCWLAAEALTVSIARPSIARKLARIRAALARGVHDPAERARYARAALTWYGRVGGDPATVRELSAIAEQR